MMTAQKITMHFNAAVCIAIQIVTISWYFHKSAMIAGSKIAIIIFFLL